MRMHVVLTDGSKEIREVAELTLWLSNTARLEVSPHSRPSRLRLHAPASAKRHPLLVVHPIAANVVEVESRERRAVRAGGRRAAPSRSSRH